MKKANVKRLNKWLGVAVLCLTLVACQSPVEPPTATHAPTRTFTPIPSSTPTSTPTFTPIPSSTPTSTPTDTSTPGHTPTLTPTFTPTGTPTPKLGSGADYFPELFHGCWHLETEDVSFEIQLQQQRADVQGTFLLIKICLVAGERSACRIREGVIEGTVTLNELEIRLSIPEYDDEGTALLTLAGDEGSLFWEELDYPEIGLADWNGHYLPPTFTLIPCDI